MKVGSLVVCVDNKGLSNVKAPALNTVYTVRRIRTVGEKIKMGIRATIAGVLLEEIINPIEPLRNEEYGYKVFRFKEVQPPIANIEEHINENTLTPELV